jgi:hypothetical protein
MFGIIKQKIILKGYVYIVVVEAKWKDDGKSWFQEVW